MVKIQIDKEFLDKLLAKFEEVNNLRHDFNQLRTFLEEKFCQDNKNASPKILGDDLRGIDLSNLPILGLKYDIHFQNVVDSSKTKEVADKIRILMQEYNILRLEVQKV